MLCRKMFGVLYTQQLATWADTVVYLCLLKSQSDEARNFDTPFGATTQM